MERLSETIGSYKSRKNFPNYCVIGVIEGPGKWQAFLFCCRGPKMGPRRCAQALLRVTEPKAVTFEAQHPLPLPLTAANLAAVICRSERGAQRIRASTDGKWPGVEISEAKGTRAGNVMGE
jgi:hypothetical protein